MDVSCEIDHRSGNFLWSTGLCPDGGWKRERAGQPAWRPRLLPLAPGGVKRPL
jgi:hypothetical protein